MPFCFASSARGTGDGDDRATGALVGARGVRVAGRVSRAHCPRRRPALRRPAVLRAERPCEAVAGGRAGGPRVRARTPAATATATATRGRNNLPQETPARS